MSKTNKKEPTRRNFHAEAADLRQRSAGGAHKDKRQRRQSRTSWKKELAFDL